MAPYSPAPLPFNSAGSHESQRHSWTSGMPGRPTDSFRFNSSRAPARPGRRLPKRLVVMLIFLVFVLLADALWLHSLIFTRVEGGGAELAAVEQGLIDLLVKQKEALEANPPVEEIQAYADRFKVLLVSCCSLKRTNGARLAELFYPCRTSTGSKPRSTSRVSTPPPTTSTPAPSPTTMSSSSPSSSLTSLAPPSRLAPLSNCCRATRVHEVSSSPAATISSR